LVSVDFDGSLSSPPISRSVSATAL
jgi:hypothetical protein